MYILAQKNCISSCWCLFSILILSDSDWCAWNMFRFQPFVVKKQIWNLKFTSFVWNEFLSGPIWVIIEINVLITFEGRGFISITMIKVILEIGRDKEFFLWIKNAWNITVDRLRYPVIEVLFCYRFIVYCNSSFFILGKRYVGNRRVY